MTQRVIAFSVFLASPSDVLAERQMLAVAADEWNGCIGKVLRIRLDLVRWETHSVPDAAKPPQTAINSQLLDDVDIGVAVFGQRLGSPTEGAESGTAEEIERLVQTGRRVLVYFKDAIVTSDGEEKDEAKRLAEYRSRLMKRSLVASFKDSADLKQLFFLHVTACVMARAVRESWLDSGSSLDAATSLISDLSGQAIVTAASSDRPQRDERLTAPLPDVRVSVFVGELMSRRKARPIVQIKIENHSPIIVFGGQIGFLLDDGQALFAPRDAVTGDWQVSRKLVSGESYAFRVLPGELARKAEGRSISDVVFTDDIGRKYHAGAKDIVVLNDFIAGRENEERPEE